VRPVGGEVGAVDAAPIPLHGRRWSVNLTLPPLGAVFLTPGVGPTLESAGPAESQPYVEDEP